MWSRLISLNNLVKLKLKQKIHIQHCVFHAPLLLRKRCSPVPKFPLPCYLNCSNFFTTPICHCVLAGHTFLYTVHIFGDCIFLREWWQWWKGHYTVQISHSASTVPDNCKYFSREEEHVKCPKLFIAQQFATSQALSLDSVTNRWARSYMDVYNSKCPRVVIFVHFRTVVSSTFLERGRH